MHASNKVKHKWLAMVDYVMYLFVLQSSVFVNNAKKFNNTRTANVYYKDLTPVTKANLNPCGWYSLLVHLKKWDGGR